MEFHANYKINTTLLPTNTENRYNDHHHFDNLGENT